ncbi:MAG TPA: DNA-processing protein DprA [Puia sp.]|nr:DNA-processing protein DprA [Puia sp.]
MSTDLLYQIALSLLPQIGDVHARILVEHFGEAESIFRAKKSLLEKIEGIGTFRARSVKSFQYFPRAEEEIAFIEKYKIQPLFITDQQYPRHLLNCYDAPVLLYHKGNTDLNHTRIIALIGTRTHTEYGKQLVEKLVRDLVPFDILIVSGLAFGIDALAHRSALKHKLHTVGVLGHGLDKLYPPEHISLAKEMMHNGGLLTEFPSRTKPDKHNFPIRNRIVAGMSDASIVIETGIKGGSMITADLANGYNKDVFAFPGRTTDTKSSGCNELIRTNRAMLLTDAAQLVETMGWNRQPDDAKKIKQQKEIFITLTEIEKKIVDILKEKSAVHIDEIHLHCDASASSIAAAVLNLELQGIIGSLPGKMYCLL